MNLGEYIPNSNTKLLLHLNGNSTDSSGNNNNGTDTNITYGLAYGRFGQGASFNGSTTRIALPQMNISTNILTYVVWVKFNNPPGTGYFGGQIVDLRNSGASNMVLLTVAEWDRKIYFYTTSSTENVNSSILLPDYTNYHLLVGVMDGTYSKLYVDGKLIDSKSFSSTVNINNGSNLASIGQEYNNGADRHFSGYIDEVIIELSAWSAEKIKKYYTMTKGRFGIL